MMLIERNIDLPSFLTFFVNRILHYVGDSKICINWKRKLQSRVTPRHSFLGICSLFLFTTLQVINEN